MTKAMGEDAREHSACSHHDRADDPVQGLDRKRGALVAGVDDKGPAKPAGIEAGDVIVKFDGKDIREMRDLPRVVADTPVGKDVPVIIVRKGKEETKTVTLGRLEDGEKQAALTTPAKLVTAFPAPSVETTRTPGVILNPTPVALGCTLKRSSVAAVASVVKSTTTGPLRLSPSRSVTPSPITSEYALPDSSGADGVSVAVR